MAAAAADRPLAGMLLMSLAVALLTAMDGTAKYLVRDYPLWQVVWARYTFNFLGLLPIIAWLRQPAWQSRAPGLQLARVAALVAATYTMFLSLKWLPMAETYAVAFTSPLLVALLAGPALGERVPPHRWAAAAAGFLGVLVVLRPGSGLFGAAAFAPLAMAFAFALYQLATRALGARDTVFTTMFWSAGLGALVTAPLLPANWNTPEAAGWSLMILMGLLGLGAHLAMIQAFALGAASLVSPFLYTQIVWAILFGYLVFGDLPDRWTLAGAALVVASGLWLLWRETGRRSPAARR